MKKPRTSNDTIGGARPYLDVNPPGWAVVAIVLIAVVVFALMVRVAVQEKESSGLQMWHIVCYEGGKNVVDTTLYDWRGLSKKGRDLESGEPVYIGFDNCMFTAAGVMPAVLEVER